MNCPNPIYDYVLVSNRPTARVYHDNYYATSNRLFPAFNSRPPLV